MGAVVRAYDLWVRKRDLAVEIKGLTAHLSDFLSAGKAEDLLALLKRRQALMEEFDAVAAALRELGAYPLPREGGGAGGSAGGAQAAEIGRLAAEVEAALQEALALEEANRRRAECMRAGAKAALEEFYRKKGTWQAYRGSGAGVSGCFVDTKK